MLAREVCHTLGDMTHWQPAKSYGKDKLPREIVVHFAIRCTVLSTCEKKVFRSPYSDDESEGGGDPGYGTQIVPAEGQKCTRVTRSSGTGVGPGKA